jgi:radical SAM protein with 4Fe4S-binding SPASM domain
MINSPYYKSEIKNELSLEDCKKIMFDLIETCKKLKAEPRINFTGGDPCLRKDFLDILKFCQENKISVGILGNSYNLDEKYVKELKKLNVESYQVSLDGLEKTHDKFRKKGSFKDALRAFKLLKEYRIKTTCMFTLSKLNMNELIPLMNFMKDKVNIFAFSRMVCEGNAKDINEDISPEEYHKFLFKLLEEYRKIKGTTKTIYNFKDHLWTLLLYEMGLFYDYGKDPNIIYEGCSLGIRHMSILSDGSVLACRRLTNSLVGKVPEQSLYKIFVNSPELNKLREIKKMEKCKHCKLLQYCRGCPAVAAGKGKSFFSPDPQCWKDENFKNL